MWNDPNQPPYDPRDPYGQHGQYGRQPPGNFQDPNSMPTDPDSQAGPNPGNPGNPGRGGYGGNAGYERYNADGTPFQPPPYEPNPAQYPGRGHAAHWPTPQGPIGPVEPVQQPQRPPKPPPLPRRYNAPSQPQQPQQQRRPAAYDARPAPQPRQQYAPPAEHTRRRSPAGVSLPHLPIAHVILVLGVLAMGFALSQAWGTAADGTAIYIRDFTNANIQQTAGVDTGALAVRTANFLFGAVVVLAAVLILFNLVITLLNKLIGLVGLHGCATLLFFPVLWGAAFLLGIVLLAAAGFAGLGSLGNLPVVRDHGFDVATVAHHAIGFYAWCAGIVAVFIGMLGQLALRRR